MKNQFIYASLALLLFACNSKPQKSKKEKKAVTFAAITAVPMPKTLASGQKFPTDATTINNWVKNSIVINNLETNTDIITHGWDLWDAITSYTDQDNNGQKLRRFETWYTPENIKTALRSKTKNNTYKLEDLNRSHTGHLKIQHQNSHSISAKSAGIVGFVKCDPIAANHIFNKELYYFEVLKNMIQPGKIANIPAFPKPSVLIKPVFYPLTKVDSLGPDRYKLPAWPGYHNQIPMSQVIAKGFGTNSWNNDITITINGTTDAANKIFSINDFINFKLNKEQAANIVNVIDKGVAKAGDYAVLVGMHLNTRENKRWTWQTFWWSETPTTPQSPSSTLIASQQPTSLEKAAKHYAMGIAYSMISPSQPNTGGANAITKTDLIKESIYAYNPYLEAGFSVDTFNLSPTPENKTTRGYSGANDTIRKYYSEGYQKVGAFRASEKNYVGGKLNKAGIETNCMSCHGQARIYDVAVKEDAFQYYAADQYYDMNAPYFKNTVVLDFAWSIQGNLINKEAPAKK